MRQFVTTPQSFELLLGIRSVIWLTLEEFKDQVSQFYPKLNQLKDFIKLLPMVYRSTFAHTLVDNLLSHLLDLNIRDLVEVSALLDEFGKLALAEAAIKEYSHFIQSGTDILAFLDILPTENMKIEFIKIIGDRLPQYINNPDILGEFIGKTSFFLDPTTLSHLNKTLPMMVQTLQDFVTVTSKSTAAYQTILLPQLPHILENGHGKELLVALHSLDEKHREQLVTNYMKDDLLFDKFATLNGLVTLLKFFESQAMRWSIIDYFLNKSDLSDLIKSPLGYRDFLQLMTAEQRCNFIDKTIDLLLKVTKTHAEYLSTVKLLPPEKQKSLHAQLATTPAYIAICAAKSFQKNPNVTPMMPFFRGKKIDEEIAASTKPVRLSWR